MFAYQILSGSEGTGRGIATCAGSITLVDDSDLHGPGILHQPLQQEQVITVLW